MRVFTYLVGPPQYSDKELREMACDYKGRCIAVPTMKSNGVLDLEVR